MRYVYNTIISVFCLMIFTELYSSHRNNNKKIYWTKASLHLSRTRLPGDVATILPTATKREINQIYMLLDDPDISLVEAFVMLAPYDLRDATLLHNKTRHYINAPHSANTPGMSCVLLIQQLIKNNLRLSIRDLIENLTPIKPRYFAIGNFPNEHSPDIELFIDGTEFFIDHHPYTGMTISCIQDPLPSVNATINIHYGRSRIPTPNRPLIMICKHTGISPCRALWQYRKTRNAYSPSLLICEDQEAWLPIITPELQKLNINYMTYKNTEDLEHKLRTHPIVTNFFANKSNVFICGLSTKTILSGINNNQALTELFAPYNMSPSQYIINNLLVYT